MKFLLKTMFLLLLALRLSGQNPVEEQLYHWLNYGDTTLSTIVITASNYLDTTQSPTKLEFSKLYGRWHNYWHSHIDSNDRMDKAWLYSNTYFQNNAPPNPNAGANPFVCNEGGDWSLVGPISSIVQELGFVSCLYTPSANSDLIYAGSNTGGLWKTSNANDPFPVWQCVTDDKKRPAMGIQAIVADPNNTDILYIATGLTTHSFFAYGSGVLTSINGGVDWTPSGLSWPLTFGEAITSLKTHPTTSGVILAGGDGNIYRSTDFGAHWTRVLHIPGIGNIGDIEYLPANHNIILASAASDQYYSVDGGINWTFLPFTNCASHTRLEIATTLADPTCFYVHFGGCGDDVYKNQYNNGSFTGWGIVYNNLGTGVNNYKTEFVINQVNASIMYIGAVQTYKIVNGVRANIHNGNHDDIRDLQILSSDVTGNNDILIAATDGGISKTTNGTAPWTNKNGYGPQITQFHDMGLTSEKKGYVIAGAQDNHSFVYDGNNWINTGQSPGGDGMQSLVSWDDPSRAYASGNCALYRSTNAAATTFASANYNIRLNNQFENYTLRQDPNDSKKLYAAKEKTFEVLNDNGFGNITVTKTIAQNRTAPFTSNIPIVNNAPNGPFKWWVQSFEVAPSNPDIIYVSIGWQFLFPYPSLVSQQKLWRSDDGGDTWIAMGNFYWNIEKIAIDPNKPDRIWLGMQGFGSTTNPLNGRVLYSDNANSTNATFTDVSTGLPFFPIQSLIYQKYSNDILYCGNDVGVYRFDAANQKWVCFTQNLPSIIVADLEINYCEKKLYASAYGRGIWSSPLYEDKAWNITTNHTIPVGRKEHHANDILVKAGATLSVLGTLNMGKDTKIIIEVGGKIFLNGGHITNLCGEVWQGIEVWGSNNGNTQDPSQQGYLEIVGGTISYAKEAVRLWKPGNLSTTGGVVKAVNATFLNNWRSVEFIRFQNGILGQGGVFIPRPNLSFFSSCTFKVDDDYREFSARVPFLGHISMWAVDGIKIVGCNFENRVTNHPLFTRAEDYGYGILSADAQFEVLQSCSVVGCPTWTPNTFYRMFEAIRVSRISSAFSPTVDRAVFSDCHYGVINDGVNLLHVSRSSFQIGGFPVSSSNSGNIHEGIILNAANGFNITENNFSNSIGGVSSPVRLGTRVVAAGGNFNRIYKNTLSSTFGHLANGTNANQNSGEGLYYECNTHSNAISDITAFNGVNNDPLVIGQVQGSLLTPAGNTFSNTLIFNANNYINPPQTTVNYWFNVLAPNQNPVLNRNLARFGTNNVNGCASILPPTSGDVSEELIATESAALLASYTQSDISFQGQRDTFNNKLDRGNTTYWLNLVQTAGHGAPANAVAKDLEDIVSPWVSESVLRAMFANPNFIDNKIYKVLEANPDVLRQAAFMDFVINSNRFNASQLNKLYQAMALKTERTERGSLVAAYAGERSQAVYSIIRNELNRQNGVDWLEIDAWLQKIPSPETDYARVEIYRYISNWQKSTFILDSMPAKYNYNAAELSDHQDYRQLQLLLCVVDSANLSIFDYDSIMVQALQILADKGYARAHIQAQSILNFAYEGNYFRPAIFPDLIQARPLQKEIEEAEADQGKELWVRPNPAKDRAEVVVNLSQDDKNAIIKVVDINGKVLYQLNVSKDQSTYGFDISNWTAGVYYIFVETENRKIKPVILSVVK